VATEKGPGARAVGEIVVDAEVPGVKEMTGFENHGGRTTVGGGAQPLGRVRVGIGNGDRTDGAFAGRVVGTYLHGPALARNPALADLLLEWATGRTLEPLEDRGERALREERLKAALGRRGALRRSAG
jgi:hypothetical protein